MRHLSGSSTFLCAPKKNFVKPKKVKNKANLKKCINKQGKCLSCHSTDFLSAHHIIFRSEGGDDSVSNLITLCFDCHRKAHDGYYIEDEYIAAKEFIIDVLEGIVGMLYKDTLKRLKNGHV